MKLFNCITFIVLSFNIAYAGTTGKLAGKVTDAETGEALFGVNIVVEGTKLGASSDAQGEYYILNIPPGVYTIKASMIGYTIQVYEKIRISSDLTTKVDFVIKPSTLQTQEIMIVGKKEIQKDLTSSERTIQSDQIQALPVRDVSSLLSLQAGIVRDAGGELHIRGGRSNEISYMVDGVQVINPVNRSAGISIDDQSIEELKAITGTFNAEYGQALSGVVNIVTKKGADRFNTNVTAYIGDYYSNDKDVYYVMDNTEWAHAMATALTGQGTYFDFAPYGIENFQQLENALSNKNKPWEMKKSYLSGYNPLKRNDIQANLSGPIPFTNKLLSYFVAVRSQYSPRAQYGKRYFMPWGLWTPIMDTDPSHTYDMPDNKIVPLGFDEGYSTQSKIYFILDDFSVSYGLYYNYGHSYGNVPSKYVPDGGRHDFTTAFTHIVSATYIFSNSTFIDIKGSYYQNKNKGYLYEDPFDYRYIPTNSGDFTQYIFNPSREDGISLINNPYDFVFWGNNVNRYNNNTNYYSLNLDLTSQVDKYNLMKIGASIRNTDLSQDGYNLQFSDDNYRPIIPETYSPYRTNYSAKPLEMAGYIQDKIEYDELIINLGLRFDYFNSKGRVLADPQDPQIYSPFKVDHKYKYYDDAVPQEQWIEYTVAEREQFWWKKTEAKYQLSPRFGLSFPITDKGVIHFSYGHFFQNPELRYLFQNPFFWVAGAGATNLVGNADINPERTVMYELGLQQQLSDNFFIHITGFYRDIRDWIGTGFALNTYSGQIYYSYENRDHAVAKGITVSSSLTFNNLSIRLDYTYMSAVGSASNPNDAYNAVNAGLAPIIQLINLNWDQPHSANMVISYAKGSWSGSLIGTLNSGFPYTPQVARGESQGSNAFIGWRENSERRPTTINFDVRLTKSFDLGAVDLMAMLDITNLFDTRNVTNVYADTGLPDFTLQDYNYGSRLVEISSSKEFFTNPGNYTNPRYISLGLRLSYN